jgi:DNA polymerase-3 subunit alpha
MHKLFDIVVNNQGKRELKILVKSKLADIELESGIKVNDNLEKEILKVKGVYIIDVENSSNK